MRIRDLRQRLAGGVARAEAEVEWETSDKPWGTLFVEADERFEGDLWADPNAFLTACLLPAWHAGERRVAIDAPLCPVLVRNLSSATTILKTWYPDAFGPVPAIEPASGFEVRRPRLTESAMLLSCGVDSLATLRWNKLHLPPDHPSAIGAGILVAHDDEPEPSADLLRRHTEGRMTAAEAVCRDAGCEAIPVRTNMWWLADDGNFFDWKWHGAFFLSVAGFFSQRFHKVYIAASAGDVVLGFETLWGSAPLLDTLYSSAHFQVEHDGLEMTRLDKAGLLADWPTGRDNIRVCQSDLSGTENCGTCSKCILTMTTLEALGRLRKCRAFPHDEVSPELLRTVADYELKEHLANAYRNVLPHLDTGGRGDLAAVIREFLLPHDREIVAVAQKQARKAMIRTHMLTCLNARDATCQPPDPRKEDR